MPGFPSIALFNDRRFHAPTAFVPRSRPHCAFGIPGRRRPGWRGSLGRLRAVLPIRGGRGWRAWRAWGTRRGDACDAGKRPCCGADHGADRRRGRRPGRGLEGGRGARARVGLLEQQVFTRGRARASPAPCCSRSIARPSRSRWRRRARHARAGAARSSSRRGARPQRLKPLAEQQRHQPAGIRRGRLDRSSRSARRGRRRAGEASREAELNLSYTRVDGADRRHHRPRAALRGQPRHRRHRSALLTTHHAGRSDLGALLARPRPSSRACARTRRRRRCSCSSCRTASCRRQAGKLNFAGTDGRSEARHACSCAPSSPTRACSCCPGSS